MFLDVLNISNNVMDGSLAPKVSYDAKKKGQLILVQKKSTVYVV